MKAADSWWIAATAVACATAASPGLARPADTLIEFNQPAQPLGSALRSLARASGVEILFDENALTHRRAPALLGRMTSSDALRRLLLNSDFVSVDSRTGVFIIIPAAARPLKPTSAPVDPSQIIVTARKRDERGIDVPIALTVFGGAQLEQRGARSLSDFLVEAPGVGIYDNGKGQAFIQIRGIATSLGSNENGFYLDDMPLTGVTVPFVPVVSAWDLDRVEVLRGPQGTLFGDGSMGGTVRILTNGANLNKWEIKGDSFISGTQGGATNGGVMGALNAPIIPGILAARVTGSHEHYNGWLDNNDAGTTNVNDQTYNNFRAKIRFEPTNRLSINGSYWSLSSNFPGGGSAARDNGQQSESNASLAGSVKYKLYDISARYDLGGAELFYDYANIRSSLLQHGLTQENPLFSAVSVNSQSHELRMASKGSAPLKWTMGIFLRNSKRNDALNFGLLDINNLMRTKSDTYALFGEGTYSLTDVPIELTAGLRYFHDRLHAVETNSGVFMDDGANLFHAVSPRFAVAWHPEANTTIYTSATKGFRSGQIQPTFVNTVGAPFGISFPKKLKSDSIWTFELGAKATLWNNRLTLESSVFYSDWKALPVREPISNTGFNGLINSKGTHTWGVEWNMAARPVKGLSLSVEGAYVGATYAGSVPGTDIVDGAPVDDVVRFSVSASADYRTALAIGMEGFVHTSWEHSSPRSAPSFPAYRAGDTINRIAARLGVDFGRFSLALFAENLSNDSGAISYRTVTRLTATTNDIAAPRLRPRTIGVEANFDFGGPTGR